MMLMMMIVKEVVHLVWCVMLCWYCVVAELLLHRLITLREFKRMLCVNLQHGEQWLRFTTVYVGTGEEWSLKVYVWYPAWWGRTKSDQGIQRNPYKKIVEATIVDVAVGTEKRIIELFTFCLLKGDYLGLSWNVFLRWMERELMMMMMMTVKSKKAIELFCCLC